MTTTAIDTVRQMLEALKFAYGFTSAVSGKREVYEPAIAAGHALLEQMEWAEPVGWRCVSPPCKCDSTNYKQCCYANYPAQDAADAALGAKIRKLVSGGTFDLTDSPKSFVSTVKRLVEETATMKKENSDET